MRNAGKANAALGAVDTATRIANGDYTGGAISSVQTGLGAAAGYLPKGAGWLAAGATIAGGVGHGIEKYRETGDLGQSTKAAAGGIVKGGLQAGAMAIAPTALGASVSVVGGALGIEGATAAGAAVAGFTGAALTTGGLVIAAGAAGYAIGTGIDKGLGVSDKIGDSFYRNMERQTSEHGNTLDMKSKGDNGLPIIDSKHNKELAKIISQNPKEAQQLSSNPELAAKGITNAQDPAYIKSKLDENKDKIAKSENRGWFKRTLNIPDSQKIVDESECGMAEIEFNAYRHRFEQWQKQPQTAQPQHDPRAVAIGQDLKAKGGDVRDKALSHNQPLPVTNQQASPSRHV